MKDSTKKELKEGLLKEGKRITWWLFGVPLVMLILALILWIGSVGFQLGHNITAP